MASALLDALSKLTQADLDAFNKELDELQVQVAQLTELKHRLRAREFLMANGPTKQAALAHRCNIPQGSITAVLKHEWFTTTSRGVELTRSLKKEPT